MGKEEKEKKENEVKEIEIKDISEIEKSSKNRLIIIAALVVVLIVVIAVCFLLSSKGKDSPNTGTGTNTTNAGNVSSGSNNKSEISSKELEKKIESSVAIADDGTFVAFISNKNDVTVDIEVEVEFYDADGKIVGNADTGLDAVGAKNDIALGIMRYSIPEEWDNYKMYVDVEKSNYTSYTDKVSLNHNYNGEEVIVQVTNNSEEEIEETTVSVVYYKDDKVIGFKDNTEWDTKPGRSANFTFNKPYDKNYRDINFDTYKVFINRAASY